MSEELNPTQVEETTKNRVFKRGQIYYIHEFPTCGSEQKSGRPGVIVSNDFCNSYSPVLEICYLTLQRKSPLPTHVKITEGACVNSTILCEQITSVSVDRIGDFKCDLPESLYGALDDALRISLAVKETTTSPDISNLSMQELYALTPQTVMNELLSLKEENSVLHRQLRIAEDANKSIKETPAALAKQLKVATSEAELYKRLYNELLDKLIFRGAQT